MKSLMLVTADYASVDTSTGKINILGIFRNIIAQKFPIAHRTMSIVTKLSKDFGDKDENEFKVSIMDEDGNELFVALGGFTFRKNISGIEPEHVVIMELRDFVFPHEGVYTVGVLVDNISLASTDIILIQHQDG